MSQNNFVEQHIKEYGRALDYEEKLLKKEAREEKKIAKQSKTLIGLKAKIFKKKRHAEKIQLKKNEIFKEKKVKDKEVIETEGLPAYLLDRQNEGKKLNDKIKQRRQDKASKFSVPIAKVEGKSQKEIFGVVTSGKRNKKQWKRIINKPCFVGNDFTRNIPKREKFIRPMSQRMSSAHVVHPEYNCTYKLPIMSVKKNPHGELYTDLGVLTKGTIIEVNVSELGMVNGDGMIIWGKYAQISNNPENDGCVNAVLLQ
ncbi:NSA2 [Hepatospora eriocheir]|uniref:NSA2 n=2 Tax=Hepatospora eriocheir TaxID=1081669 RepID=A0A1X0QFB4_9MICR|nr:NSA2 [Hepatospora eriocheir]